MTLKSTFLERRIIMSLGEKLKNARKNEKMTQLELANYLGLDKATISHYEKNNIMPSLQIFKNLCELFKLSADELLDLK